MISTTIAQSVVFSQKKILSDKILKKIIFILIFFGILPLLSFYLFQIGEIVKENYLIKVYEAETVKNYNKIASLQEGINTVLSLKNAEEKTKELNFVKVSEIKYIPISNDYLAKNSF